MLPKDKLLWEKFLKESIGEQVRVLNIEPIKRDKSYTGGLGSTYFIELETEDGKKKVVAKISGKKFGRENPEDRAKDALWIHRTSTLPRQPKAIAVGSITKDGRIIPLRSDSEYVVVLEEAKGISYHIYLNNILKMSKNFNYGLSEHDLKATLNLSNYLVEIHKRKSFPELYKRHIGDIVGGPEGILGVDRLLWKVLDEKEVKEKLGKSKAELRKEIIELKKKAIEHADRIEDMTHRCSRIHGDFHPFENILFSDYPTDFWVLDRSRAEFGEPADDVTAMWINYLNYALLDEGSYRGKFKKLGDSFLENYLEKTNDYEMLKVVQPFFIWRGLVIATPVWYPETPVDVRNKIFNFMKNVSDVEEFNPKEVNSYLLD
jgi:hypothetical protein